MKGTMFIIRPEDADHTRIERHEKTEPPTLDEWQAACGGYVQKIPGLQSCRPLIGSVARCVALCNEDGLSLRLPVNRVATALWHGTAPRFSTQTLVGNVIVLTGDDEFMDSL